MAHAEKFFRTALMVAEDRDALVRLLESSEEAEICDAFAVLGLTDAPLPADTASRATLFRILAGVELGDVRYTVPADEDRLIDLYEVRASGGPVTLGRQRLALGTPIEPGDREVREIAWFSDDDDGPGDAQDDENGDDDNGARPPPTPPAPAPDPATLPKDYWRPGRPFDLPKPAGGAAVGYHRVNFKVVFWIPYFGNGPIPPFTRVYKPWNGKLTGTQSQVLRGALATGNPDPPDAFPTFESYARFYNGKEYRAILDIDIYFCCNARGAVTAGNYRFNATIGYTPAISNVPVENLEQYHKENETISSIIEREVQADTPNSVNSLLKLGQLAGYLPFGPEILRALRFAAQRNSHPLTAEFYSKGNGSGRVRAQWAVGGLTGMGEIDFQVNDVDNVLYYALAGRLLPYMWGLAKFEVACDGTASLILRGSVVPNRRVYINNRAVGTWDFLARPVEDVLAVLPVATTDDPNSGNNDKALLDSPSMVMPRRAKPFKGVQISANARVPRIAAECPGDFPTDWPQ